VSHGLSSIKRRLEEIASSDFKGLRNRLNKTHIERLALEIGSFKSLIADLEVDHDPNATAIRDQVKSMAEQIEKALERLKIVLQV
jgi:hypothetical protein